MRVSQAARFQSHQVAFWSSLKSRTLEGRHQSAVFRELKGICSETALIKVCEGIDPAPVDAAWAPQLKQRLQISGL